MKKLGMSLLAVVLVLSGCKTAETKETKVDTPTSVEQKAEEAKAPEADAEKIVIKVASHMPPMTDVVKVAKEEIQSEGYDIELVQVNDNVQYNELLNNKEVDANFAQHAPYMMKYNSEKDGNLVVIAKIYDAKVGFYSKHYKTIDEIEEGKKIAIPSDPSNEGRALAILDDYGVIKLAEGVGFEGKVKDIVENPKNLEFLSVDLLNLSEAYAEDEVALVYNYPAYIAKIDLTPDDAVILEKKIDDRFSIALIAREDNKDSDEIVALKKAFTSDAVKKYLEDNHGTTVIPSF